MIAELETLGIVRFAGPPAFAPERITLEDVRTSGVPLFVETRDVDVRYRYDRFRKLWEIREVEPACVETLGAWVAG